MFKQLLFSIALCIATVQVAPAQEISTAVTELRSIISNAGNGFKTYKGAIIESDSTSGAIYYSSAQKPVSPMAAHYIIENTQTKHNFYMISYDLTTMDNTQLTMMVVLAEQYMLELNNMVNGGGYTGSDYKNEEGADITEIKDKDGQNILDYQSNGTNQVIIIYGTNGH